MRSEAPKIRLFSAIDARQMVTGTPSSADAECYALRVVHRRFLPLRVGQ
jgi:hypothetical protein